MVKFSLQLILVQYILVLEGCTLETITIIADKFASQLKQLRKEKNMTQKELAEKAQVTQQTISAIENGRLDPSLKLLITIAVALGVALLINAILSGKGED